MTQTNEERLIVLDEHNLASEHICCAIADKKSLDGIRAKKDWLAQRLREGLVFRRLNQRGKVFIEYLPLEAAWVPVEGDASLFINCFWVSGSHAGKGWGRALLDSCIADARSRGRASLSIIASDKKRPFLADPGSLKRAGFLPCDEAPPYFRLYYLPLAPDAPAVRFSACAQHTGTIPSDVPDRGLFVRYTAQCPFTNFQLKDVEAWARERGVPFAARQLASRREARQNPVAWTTWSVYWQGAFVTHELLNAGRAEKLLGPLLANR